MGGVDFFFPFAGWFERSPRPLLPLPLCACMVSCFRQSGSAPSFRNPFHWSYWHIIQDQFTTSALWTLRTWQKALNSFEKRLVKLHEILGPGCDVHMRHPDIWVVFIKTANQFEKEQKYSDRTSKFKDKMYERILKILNHFYHVPCPLLWFEDFLNLFDQETSCTSNPGTVVCRLASEAPRRPAEPPTVKHVKRWKVWAKLITNWYKQFRNFISVGLKYFTSTFLPTTSAT